MSPALTGILAVGLVIVAIVLMGASDAGACGAARAWCTALPGIR